MADGAWDQDRAALIWFVREGRSIPEIARLLKRSISAVRAQLKREHICASSSSGESYSFSDVADLLGVPLSQVLAWDARGYIGKHIDRDGQPVVRSKLLRRFLIAHISEYRLSAIEQAGHKALYVDLLGGGDDGVGEFCLQAKPLTNAVQETEEDCDEE